MDDPAKTNPPVTSSLPSMGDDSTPPMPIVTTPTGGDMQSAAPRKKFGTGKIVAAIFGVLLLVGGAVAGVLLVQQQQDIREKAQVGCCNDNCLCACWGGGTDKNWYCSTCWSGGGTGHYDSASDSCQFNPPPDDGGDGGGGGGGGLMCQTDSTKPVAKCARFECPTGCGTDNKCGGGSADDPDAIYSESCAPLGSACGQIDYLDASGNYCGHVLNCSGVCADSDTPQQKACNDTCTNTQECAAANANWVCDTTSNRCRHKDYLLETDCTPGVASAQCLNVVAYDTNWVQITDLTTLKVGDIVRFVVKGSATAGTFDKARFTINSATRPEVTQKRPGTTNEFYDEYTILTGTTNLTIQAELHHTTLGWF